MCNNHRYIIIYDYIEFNEHWINIRTYVCATYSVAVKIILMMAHYIYFTNICVYQLSYISYIAGYTVQKIFTKKNN